MPLNHIRKMSACLNHTGIYTLNYFYISANSKNIENIYAFKQIAHGSAI